MLFLLRGRHRRYLHHGVIEREHHAQKCGPVVQRRAEIPEEEEEEEKEEKEEEKEEEEKEEEERR